VAAGSVLALPHLEIISMASMNRCSRCHGFVPVHLVECPNCVASGRRGRAKVAWLMFLGAGATAVTLAACYGAPPCDGCSSTDAASPPTTSDAHPRSCTDGGIDGGADTDGGAADGGCP
jgi:hypothetical protein